MADRWRGLSRTWPPTRASAAEVKRFLDAHPGSSFHTCSGGSTYSHTFEIGGRYANYNYLSDLGRGPVREPLFFLPGTAGQMGRHPRFDCVDLRKEGRFHLFHGEIWPHEAA